MRIGRRKLLAFGGGSILLSGLSAYGISQIACAKILHHAATNPATVENLVASWDSVESIGRNYLSEFRAGLGSPAHDRKAESIRMAMSLSCSESGTSSILEQISQDFREGDVVKVDGWVTARSEAIFCSYLVLLNSA